MKNLRALIFLFAANTISGFSQGVSMIAIPWYFADTLEAPELFGKIYFGITCISLFWGMYVGTLVDKYNRKNLFLGENIFGAVVFLSVGIFGILNGLIPTFLVILCFACTFFVYNVHYPTLYAFSQEIIEPKHYGKISTWLEIQGQLTSMSAGALAALLLTGINAGEVSFLGFSFNIPFTIKAWDLSHVFLMDGITYTCSFILISMIVYVPTVQRKKESGNVIQQLKKGIGFLQKNPLIFVFGNASYFIFVTIMVTNYFVMPNHIKYLGGDGNAYALSEMFYAIGALGAGLSVRFLFNKTTTVFGNIALTLLGAFTLILLYFNTSLTGLYLLLFFLAVSNSGSRIMRVIYMLEHVPNQVIGRAQSVFQVINVLLRMLFIGLFSLTFFTSRTYLDFLILGIFAIVAAGILIVFYRQLINVKVEE